LLLKKQRNGALLTFFALGFRAASVGCGFLGAAFTRKGVDHVFRALWLSRFWGRGFSTIGFCRAGAVLVLDLFALGRARVPVRFAVGAADWFMYLGTHAQFWFRCRLAAASFRFALPSVPGATGLLTLFVIEFFAFTFRRAGSFLEVNLFALGRARVPVRFAVGAADGSVMLWANAKFWFRCRLFQCRLAAALICVI